MENAQLTQRLDSILAFLEESLKAGTEFAVEQAPDVVNQLLAWKFTVSLITFSTAGLVFVGTCYGLYRLWKWGLGPNGDHDVVGGATCFALFPLSVSFMVLIFNLDWLKIWIAPKVYLLEYAASLLSK